MTELANGSSLIELSKDDVCKAVEFWLNEKILKMPCKVSNMEKVNQPFTLGSFTVFFQEKTLEDEND